MMLGGVVVVALIVTMRFKQRGFTLIELLIVISLIGILSGVVVGVINVSGLRAKARDSIRTTDLDKIKVSLELYYTDNRSFPTTGNLSTLSPTYMANIPTDPVTGTDYCYASNGDRYILAASMEVASSAAKSPCTDLTSWSPPLNGVCAGLLTCYGVESSLGVN